jgi:ammonia channel protein AmtB
MRHVPWFTLAAIVVFFITPLGQSMLESAFYSGERLANNIAQFMLMVVAGIVVALAALEWAIKYYIRRRRARMLVRG